MPRLVALAATGGAAFVTRLRRAWDGGDAVLPVDPRLPRPALERLVGGLGPAVVVDASGTERSVGGGRPVEDGDALVLSTSGSTGSPKGVVLSHQAVVASARATSARLGTDPATDRWLACLPLAHVGGLSVVTRALATGTPVVVHDRFDPAAVEEEAVRGATLTSLVATALGRVDVGRFRTVLLGGGPPPTGPIPANVVTTYGMTETGSGIVYDGIPLPGVEVRIVEDEIQVRGPMLLRCYRDGYDPKTAEGWLATRDAGFVDESGRLQVLGRRDDVIITGGENVWPQAVEDLLGTHPQVAEVAVAGVGDPEWGQRVTAWVVPSDPSLPPALAGLRDFVMAQLPAYCAPREVVVVGSLPRTALGKVARHRLPGYVA